LLRTLCLSLHELRVADERSVAAAAAAATAARNAGLPVKEGESERAPFDLLSLQALCLAHLGLELVSAWGLGARLNPRSFGCLRAVGPASRPLSKPVAQLLLPNSGGGSGTTAAAHAAKVLRLDAEEHESLEEGRTPSGASVATTTSLAAATSAAWQYEISDKRKVRALVCAVCIERVLRVPQLRPLLLQRYLPDLLTTWMDLIESQAENEATSATTNTAPTNADSIVDETTSETSRQRSNCGSSSGDSGHCIATWAETSLQCALSGRCNATAAAASSSDLMPASAVSRADWLQREHFSRGQAPVQRNLASSSSSSSSSPPVQAPSLAVAVAALRGLATTAAKKKAPPYVRRIVGGHLSHLLCYTRGGLEAVLASYLSPSAGGSAAAESGSVAAVEKLASHLAKLPAAFLPEPSLATSTSTSSSHNEARSEASRAAGGAAPAVAAPTSATTASGSSVNGPTSSREFAAAVSGAAQYVACLAPQLQSLLDRSLFVYGLGDGHPDDDDVDNVDSTEESKEMPTERNGASKPGSSSIAAPLVDLPPPPGALPGLMAHMSVRLLGRLADTAQTSDKHHVDTAPSEESKAKIVKAAAAADAATTASLLATHELACAAVVPLLAPLLLLLPITTVSSPTPFALTDTTDSEEQDSSIPIEGSNATTESSSSSSFQLSNESSVVASSGALHKSLVALHAWTALVPPTPSLVRLLVGTSNLNGSSLDSIIKPSDGGALSQVKGSNKCHCQSSTACNAFCSSGHCVCAPLASSLLEYGVLPALLELLVALRQDPSETASTTTCGDSNGAIQSGITELDSSLNQDEENGDESADTAAAQARRRKEELRRAARARHAKMSERRALASASALLARLPPRVAAQQLSSAVRLVSAKPLANAMGTNTATSTTTTSRTAGDPKDSYSNNSAGATDYYVGGSVVLHKLSDHETDACEDASSSLTEGDYERGLDGAVSDGWVIATVPPQTSKGEDLTVSLDVKAPLMEPASALEALKSVRRTVEEQELNQACEAVLAQLPAEEDISDGAPSSYKKVLGAVWPEVAERATAAATLAVELAQLADNASGDVRSDDSLESGESSSRSGGGSGAGATTSSDTDDKDDDGDDTTVITGLFEAALRAAFHHKPNLESDCDQALERVPQAAKDNYGFGLSPSPPPQHKDKKFEQQITAQATRFADRALVAAVAGGIDPLTLFGGPNKSGGMSLLRTLSMLVEHLAETFQQQANAAGALVGGSLGVENTIAEATSVAPESAATVGGSAVTLESSGNEVAMTSVALGLLGAVVRFGPSPPPNLNSCNSIEARREVILKALVLSLGRLALALSKAAAAAPPSSAVEHATYRPIGNRRRKNNAAATAAELSASSATLNDNNTELSSLGGAGNGRGTAVAALLLPKEQDAPSNKSVEQAGSEDDEDDEDEGSGRYIALLSESANELHLDLLRRWTPNISSSSNSSTSNNNSAAKSPIESWDAFVRRRVDSNATGLLNQESPPVRAHAVANIASTLRAAAAHATEVVQASVIHDDEDITLTTEGLPADGNLKGSPLIQEISDAPPPTEGTSSLGNRASNASVDTATKSKVNPLLSDATLGMVVGTLLGMLGDGEAYVYLGAVHALQVREHEYFWHI